MKKRTYLSLTLSLTLAGVGAFAVPLPANGVEPPLTGEEGPPPATDVFQPLLEPGDALPADSVAPVLPDAPAVLPPELFPETGPGSDGVDGLPLDGPPGSPLPGDSFIPPPPGEPPLLPPPGLPPAVDPAPTIPGMEMAARAFWHRSPREARETARREKKPMLIFFYQKWKSAPGGAAAGIAGSGGDALPDPNIAVSDDLLASPEFVAFAQRSLVLTYLFYPIGIPGSKYTPEQLTALRNFKEYFKVKGFPTLILLDENGREIERVKGYSRIRTGRGVNLNASEPILERLKTAVARRETVIQAAEEKHRRLTSQNFRDFTSKTGSRLFAKLVSCSPTEVVLMDENNTLRRVSPEQLWIVDLALIHRQLKSEQQAAISR
ncbi:MAG: hypothetical protein JWL81_3245 [Verrucomicrobiales bacterium]|nr:hypothetical protein [Verrucomicrobiales bacterium]